MKQDFNLIPTVSLEDVEHFWVIGTTKPDGVIGKDSLKVDLKDFLKSEEGAENSSSGEV